MKLVDKQKLSRAAPLAAGLALTFALIATCSLALLTYLILPSSFSLPLSSLNNLTPHEMQNRRTQQLPSSTIPQISLFSGGSTFARGGFTDAFHTKSSALLPNAAGDYEQTEEYFTTLVYDFEATRAPIPSVRGLPSTLAFTLAAWVRFQHIASGERCIASHGESSTVDSVSGTASSTASGRWTLSLSTSGNLKLIVTTAGGGVLEYHAVLAVNIDEWTHLAVGYDGETHQAVFYLNGVRVPHTAPLEVPESALGGLPLQDHVFYIGVCNEHSTDQYGSLTLFTGSIGDIQIWDQLLDQDDVQSLAAPYTAENPLSTSSFTSQLVFSSAGISEIAELMTTARIPIDFLALEAASASATPQGIGGSSSSFDNGDSAASLKKLSLSALFTERMSSYVSCAVPSPAIHSLLNVEKPASITVMAWVQLSSLPKQKEACILSHGSWEHGWKLSIIPYMNIQFSVRTASGEVLDYFSEPITASLRWQHLAVSYSSEDGSVSFYANGFPLDLDNVPKIKSGKAHEIVEEPAPLTIGRCSSNLDAGDEVLEGQLTDIMIWDGVLDFQAIRSAAHGRGSTVDAVNKLRRSLPSSKGLVFALPSLGCIGKSGPLPSLPSTMAPPTPHFTSNVQRIALQDILLETLIILSAESQLSMGLRVLDGVDNQAAALLADGRFGTVKTIVLMADKAIGVGDSEDLFGYGYGSDSNETRFEERQRQLLESRFQRLEVVLTPRQGQSVIHATAGALKDIQRAEHDLPATERRIKWVLMLNDNLKPLEHWLHHLLGEALRPRRSSTTAASASSQALAVKSLTLSSGGMVKSVGLKHFLTIIGDGHVIPAPYLAYRGYKASYIRKLDPGKLSDEAEASTCESLLINAHALLQNVAEIPEGLGRLYECSALTAPLATTGALKVAVSSWILELQLETHTARWDASADSMLHRHEMHKESLQKYAHLRGQMAMQHVNSALELNLRVKWMFACGGSWAWEAANLIEHLDRRLPLRVQMQKPLKYCDGHNVLGDAPLSFAEKVERMIELPSLPLVEEHIERSSSSTITTSTLAYKTPFPLGASFLQDDVVIYHRDWFRASNWANWAIQRPRYQIGRYMNEVSGVHARVVQQCNALDEIWVPSHHHVTVFKEAGVTSTITVIPESIDVRVFDPETVDPMMLPGRKKFVFLSNFKFEERKNWRQLIYAYCKSFSATDDVSLIIHTNLGGKFDAASMQEIRDTIYEHIEATVLDGSTRHKDNSTIPHYDLTGKPLSTEAMIGLYKAASAYVLPTHGEGWGLPYMEAMALSLPVIATDWGGNLEFMGKDTGLLVRVKGFEPSDPYDDWLRNFHWATPDVNHLAELMAWCFYNPEKAKELGRRARANVVKRFSNEAVAELIMNRLKDIRKILDAEDSGENKMEVEEEGKRKASLSTAFQWTIASDVKLCANMPRAGLLAQQAQQLGNTTASAPPNTSTPFDTLPLGLTETSTTMKTSSGNEHGRAETSSTATELIDRMKKANKIYQEKIVAAAGGEKIVAAGGEKRRSLLSASPFDLSSSSDSPTLDCPSTPTRLAFLTPYVPRKDGLADYSASLRQAMLAACPTTLTIDVFAVVLDFYSAYSEPYNSSEVQHVIFRESWVDYASAAALINSKYDGALLNFKLGALGGSASSYGVCFVKSLIKPVISIIHSIHGNMDDALQFNIQQLLAESDAAVVMSHRAKLQLDTAAGFLPSGNSMLRPESVHVIPNGGPSDTPEPTIQNKSWAKEKLGMAGKRVVITAGLIGPDKGVQFVIPALFYKLPTALKENLIYIVAGQPGDCGANCIEFYSFLETQLNEFGGDLVEHVAFMPERLTLEGWKDLWAAADVAIMLYPEDIIPHPGTFSQALTAGVVPVVTPFAAAISAASESSAVLVWDRDPVHVAAGLEAVLKLSDEKLLEMQRNAWNVGQKIVWEKIGADFVSKALTPTLRNGRAGRVLQNI